MAEITEPFIYKLPFTFTESNYSIIESTFGFLNRLFSFRESYFGLEVSTMFSITSLAKRVEFISQKSYLLLNFLTFFYIILNLLETFVTRKFESSKNIIIQNFVILLAYVEYILLLNDVKRVSHFIIDCLIGLLCVTRFKHSLEKWNKVIFEIIIEVPVKSYSKLYNDEVIQVKNVLFNGMSIKKFVLLCSFLVCCLVFLISKVFKL